MLTGSVPWYTRVLGYKRKKHRDIAAQDFLENCRQVGGRLRDGLVSALREHISIGEAAARLESALQLPLLLIENRNQVRILRPLFDAHCLAMVQAVGACHIDEHIDPSHQETVMEWMVHRLIAAEDVGEANVGHAPSPRRPSGGHISWAPGSFVGGLTSPQHHLFTRYMWKYSPISALAMLLCSTRILSPDCGVRRLLWAEESLGNGLTAKNLVGYAPVTEEDVDEWDQDVEIFDPDKVLSQIPPQCLARCISLIADVDPFWPSYCARYRLTY